MRESRLTPHQWIRVMIVASVLSVVLSTTITVILGLQDTTIKIFHTNDIHGYAVETLDDDDVPEHIGYARAKTFIDAQEADHKLIIDAGDVLHGQSFATITRGESMARLLQAMGTDIFVPGNHDFDYGAQRLLDLQEQYDLPIYANNVTKEGKTIFDGYIVQKFGRIKVGIIGITTPETPIKTSPKNVEGLSFSTPEEILMSAAERVYAMKKQKCNVIIAVMHMGDESYLEPNSVQLAQLLPDIDIIIDGHSHSVLENNKVGETYIASTGEYFENLGMITIHLKGKRVQSIEADLVPAAEFKDVEPNAEIAALIEDINGGIQPILEEVVATAPVRLEGERELVRSGSTNLGRMVAEAMRLETGADICITNGGGIRASIEPGDVTKGQIISVLPYGNMVMMVNATGEEIVQVLNDVMIVGEGAFPQFSGMTVEVTEDKKKGADGVEYLCYKVKRVLINGAEIDPAKEYSVAINDFIYAGGDGYNAIVENRTAREFGSMDEVLIQYMAFPDAVELVSENNFIVVK